MLDEPALQGAASVADAPDRLTVFSFLLSAFLLFHQATTYYAWFQFANTERLIKESLIVLLCLVVLTRPSSVLRFFILLAVLVKLKFDMLPNMANHDLLTSFICLTIAAAILKHCIWPKAPRGSAAWRSGLYDEMSAVVRLELITLYFFVVLHKINTDYFNPDVSCGVMLYREMREIFSFLPGGAFIERFGLYNALLIEAMIPVLLWFRRTRVAGICLGLMFHLLLSLHHNKFIYDFSAMLYVLYFLFLPKQYFVLIRDRFLTLAARHPWNWLVRWRQIGLLVALLAAVFVGVVVTHAQVKSHAVNRSTVIDSLHVVEPIVQHGVWFVLAGFLILLMGWAIAGVRIQRKSGSIDPKSAIAGEPLLFRSALSPLLLIWVVVFFNGFCPYLGLKTESSFAMFSNIRTEGGRTNHLFMPISLRLANYQEDLIEIISSNDGHLTNLANQKLGITAFDFSKHLRSRTKEDFAVTFRRGGILQTLTLADRDASPLFSPPSAFERKLLHFRPVQMDDSPQKCGH